MARPVTVTGWLLVTLGLSVLLVVGSLLIPAPDPDAHPFVTDPWETGVEHVGRHRMPEAEGPTRRLADGPLRYPAG